MEENETKANNSSTISKYLEVLPISIAELRMQMIIVCHVIKELLVIVYSWNNCISQLRIKGYSRYRIKIKLYDLAVVHIWKIARAVTTNPAKPRPVFQKVSCRTVALWFYILVLFWQCYGQTLKYKTISAANKKSILIIIFGCFTCPL